MNTLLKRGIGAYKVFLKNKLVSSVMMLFSGFMMFVASLNGQGNDVKSLPILITVVGSLLALWGSYRIWRIKGEYDRVVAEDSVNNKSKRKELLLQIGETLLYYAVLGLGIFLLINESVMDKVLNLMAGGFTTLNGVLGVIGAIKKRTNKDFQWKLLLVLTVLELMIGPYFIFRTFGSSEPISVAGYTVMGALTTMAGIVEVISVMSHGNIRTTIDDGKKIVKILKDDDSREVENSDIDFDEDEGE